MAEEDPFEGLLATLTTEQGKEDLIREEIERQEGVEVVRVERTSTGWRVIAVPKPGGGGWDPFKSGAGNAPPEEGAGDSRVRGPGEIVWVSPPGLPFQTTPTPGCEGSAHVVEKAALVPDIERELGELGEGYDFVGNPNSPWEAWIHPDIRAVLDKFRDKIKIERKYGDNIEVTSCYRPLGTHVPKIPGAQEGDFCGKTDATDGKGHWKGKSVDLRTLPIRGFFGIPEHLAGVRNFLDEIGEMVGLYRPYLNKGDAVHWTYL
ncbi:MAG TPA: hypothetical protein VMX79_03280 [bacterium]|nr:hypothetical protein [bacterium]